MHLSNLSRVINNSGAGSLVFPVGTVVPYSGATPALSGWSRWSNADNQYCLYGDMVSNPGSQVIDSQSPSFTCSFGSAGGHTGSFGPEWISPFRFGSGGTRFSPDNSTQYGDHIHTSVTSGTITPLTPRRANFNFLVSTSSHTSLPANALVFGDGSNNYGTEFAQNSLTYISGVNGTTSIFSGVKSQVVTRFPAGAGNHLHVLGSGTIFTTGGSTANSEVAGAGGHSHRIEVEYAQEIFGSTVILRMFQLINPLLLITSPDIIVGFVGNTSLIKPPWYFCDGNNDTLDLNNKYLALNSNLTPGTLLEPDLTRIRNTTSTGSDDIFHGHDGFKSTGYSGVRFRHEYRLNLIWRHNHALTYTFNDLPFLARRVNLRFIQYKG